MRIRSLISSAAVLGTLLASSALVGDALAQKGTVMAPSTGWAVSKVGDAAGAYCALARKYNQNTVLTVARNELSETSFALDFQRPVFRSQGVMKVVLDPGAGQQRAYEIQPVSNTAFVVRLGRDNAFFGALERTGLLRVEMGGKSYHFNVADMDSGQFKLDACVANMVMPAAGEESGPLTPDMDAAIESAGKSYRQEINALRRQVASLRDENESLKVQMETRSAGVEETSSSVAQLSGQIRGLEDANATLKRELSEARASVVAATAPADVDTSALENEIATLKAENARLQAEVQTDTGAADTAQALEQIAALEAEVQSLHTRNAALQSSTEAQGESAELVAELQGQIKALEGENTALSTKILAAREEVRKEFERQIASLNDENTALKSTMENEGVDAALLDQLRQQIAQAENENRLLQETAAQAQANLETQLRDEQTVAVETARTEQAVRIAALENQVDELKAQNEVKAQELVEIGEGTADLAALQEANAALKEQLSLQQAERAQGDVMLKRIANLEGENAALKTQIEDAQQDVAVAGEEDGADAVKLAVLTAERDELKAKIAASEAQATRLQTLEREVVSLKTDNADLQAQLDTQDVQGELQAALDANAKLQAEISDKDLELLELQAVRQDLEEAKAKIAELQGQSVDGDVPAARLVELEAQHGEMKAALADLVKVSEKYRAENVQQKGRIEMLQGDLAALETENTGLKAALDVTEQDRDAASVAASEARDVLEAVKAKVQAAAAPALAKTAPKPSAAEPVERAEPVVAAVEPAPKAQPAPEPKVAQASAPKPEPVAAPMPMSEESVGGQEPEAVPSEEGRDVLAALREIEAEMRDTNPNNQRRMQALAREYMALKALADERAAMPSQGTLAAVEAPVAPVEVDYADMSGMNEAQRQEHMLKMRRQAAQAEAQRIEAEALAAPEAPEALAPVVEEPIVMSESADPFEDMRVEDAGGAPENWGGELEASAAEAEPAEIIALKPVQAPAPQGDTVVANAAPVAQQGGLSIKDLITQAQVSTPDKIKKVDEPTSPHAVAYQWNGGSIYGSAEQKTLASPAEFDVMVQDYLERTQNRCPGEFAVVPDNTQGGGNLRVDSYEVACVGADVSSGASLLFFNQGQIFTVVAHEAPTEELGEAMGLRNKVMRFVTTGS